MHERMTKQQYFRGYAALLRFYARRTGGRASTKLIEAAERLTLQIGASPGMTGSGKSGRFGKARLTLLEPRGCCAGLFNRHIPACHDSDGLDGPRSDCSVAPGRRSFDEHARPSMRSCTG